MNSDVLVLGAGPAGIAVSLLMAGSGYNVEILDPAFFPRKKICGEFLNPQATEWLHNRNLLKPLLDLNPFPVFGMKIFDLQNNSFTGHYAPRGKGKGYAIPRKEFDTIMVAEARKAGISIREGFKAEHLIIENGQAVGVSGTDSNGTRFEKRSRILVGADGRNNLIGRTFGWMRGIRHLRKYAFMTYFEGLAELSNYGEVHLVPGGYIGIAPLTDTVANVALVVDEKVLSQQCLNGNSKDFLLANIASSAMRQRFDGLEPIAPVLTAGPLAFEMVRTSGRGTILVGDTCGFIDPFTGEGINYAYLSATMAVRVLDQALRSNHINDETLAAYDRERQRTFGRKFKMARLLQKAITWPAVSKFLVQRFAKTIELGDTVVSAVGSTVPVERVWSLRFLWKVVFS
ncbi:MAG: hypothetical protein C5B54_03225 [Acidobacteria bacterium]|nr:MAG: hypothetical protein C5B54_03225 [Acidobacteriota bacterium]